MANQRFRISAERVVGRPLAGHLLRICYVVRIQVTILDQQSNWSKQRQEANLSPFQFTYRRWG